MGFMASLLLVAGSSHQVAVASGTTVLVDGRANIFGSGHAAPPAPAGGGAGILPPFITLGVGDFFTFSATGTVTYNNGGNYFGAEGGPGGGGAHYSSIGGISGIVHDARFMFLIGVFTNGTEPSGGGPPVLDFTTDSFTSVSPLLNQTFFIGDGLTGAGTGSVQRFNVPPGATRLFLGFADGTTLPGLYGDNSGFLTVTASQQLTDTDQDGIPNINETGTGSFVSPTDTGTNPANPDSDADGLTDGLEVYTYLTNPNIKDTDQDGFDDGFEVSTGFNPASALSTPDALSSILTAVEYRFNAALGISYRIETSTDLSTWTTLETPVIGNGGVITRFYSIEGQPRRFFRSRRN
jgi:hypothetical protein